MLKVLDIAELRDINPDDMLGQVIVTDKFTKVVPLAKIREGLRDNGFDPDMAKDLTVKGAFRRACKDLKKNRVIRNLKTKGGFLSFQFTREELEGEQFKYDTEAIVFVDPDSGRVICDESPELARLAEEKINQVMAERTSNDITRLVKRMFDNEAELYPMTSTGKAHFVPSRHFAFVERVARFFDHIGGELIPLPVPRGSERGNKAVSKAVQRGVNGLIAEMKEATTEWKIAVEQAETLKAGPNNRRLANQMDKAKRIRFLIEANADLLVEEANRLKGALKEGIGEMIAVAKQSGLVE